MAGENGVGPRTLASRQRAAHLPQCVFQHLSPSRRIEKGHPDGMLNEGGYAGSLPCRDQRADRLDLIVLERDGRPCSTRPSIGDAGPERAIFTEGILWSWS